MARARRAHCPRCQKQVVVDGPWRGWRFMRVGIGALIVGWALLFPVFAGYMPILVPTLIFFLATVGPIFGFAAQRDVCAECRLEL